jgi:predicted transcriptional regulator
MLIVETISKIRRAHFVQGKPIKQICRELKLSRKTVRKVLRSDETAFEYCREVQPQPKLGPWLEALFGRLSSEAPSPLTWPREVLTQPFQMRHPVAIRFT